MAQETAPGWREYFPSGQSTQSVCPSSSAYRPTGHSSHDAPSVGEYVPRSQGRQASSELEASNSAYLPALHGMHPDGDAKPSTEEYVPDVQAVHDALDAPPSSVEYRPATQPVHSVDPSMSAY